MLLLIAILMLAGSEQGQSPIAEITAEVLTNEGDIRRATGNVVLTYQDIRVEADAAEFNQATGDVKAGPRVRFSRGEEVLEADSVSLNLTTKAGVLINAKGALGPGYYITAAEAHRREDGRYHVKKATITTCHGDSPGWTFSAGSWDIDPANSIRARNSIFKLEDIPLFYLPYVIVPTVDRSRSTGFLIPSTSTSTTKGRSVRQAFYWAINRSADVTFTGEYFTKRGLAGAIDVRAVPNERSNVVINTFFAKDRLGHGGESARIFAHTAFGDGNRVVADMNIVSSFDFRQVYEEGLSLITSPVAHSLTYLTRNRPAVSVNTLYNRTSIFFEGQSSAVLRKFPAFEVLMPERRIQNLPVYFFLESGFSGVARRDAAIDSPGLAERFDVNPAIEIPILHSAAMDWSHRLGVRNTFYSHSIQTGGAAFDRPQVQGNPMNRRSLHYSSRFTGPQIEREFGPIKHVIEPGIDYRLVAGVDRFRNTMIVDDVDLLTDTNEVEYSLTNRFFARHEFFSWRVSQKYFFDPTFGGAIAPNRRNAFAPLLELSGFAFADGRRRFSPIVSSMRISTSPSTSTDIQVDYDARNRLFRAAGINGGLNRGPAFGSIAYFFTRRGITHEPNNQLRATIGYGSSASPGFSAGFNLSYDIERTLFQGTVAQVGYNTDCYGLSFEFKQFDVGARKESSFRFAFSLKNIGSYGTLGRQERLF